MYANVEQLANELGIKQTRSPRGSQLWECWADRVLQAWNYNANIQMVNKERRDEMIEAANAYAV